MFFICDMAMAALRPQYGGSLVIGTSPGPSTVDPSRALTADDWHLVNAVHEPLYRLNEHNHPIINLLSRPPHPIKDGRVWRCALRTDLVFHSGKPVLSNDVIASVQRLKNTRFGWIPKQFRFKRVTDTTFTVRSRRTIKTVDLERILASPALSILPQKWDGVSGLGPFKLQRWSPTENLSLSRHQEHHKGAPYLESLMIRRFDQKHSVRDAFRIGVLDVVFLDSLHALDKLPDSFFRKGIRVKGQRMESIGLIVPESRNHISRDERIHVRSAVTRTTVQNEIAGKTRVAQRWMPRAIAPSPKISSKTPSANNVRPWRLACPEIMKSACKAIATATPKELVHTENNPAPWSFMLLTPDQERAAQKLPATASWDALLVSIPHIDPWKRGALSTISTMIKGQPTLYASKKMWNKWVWLPLFERRAFMIHKPNIYNLKFSFTSLSDLGEVWRQ